MFITEIIKSLPFKMIPQYKGTITPYILKAQSNEQIEIPFWNVLF